jgi:hypothetical protein
MGARDNRGLLNQHLEKLLTDVNDRCEQEGQQFNPGKGPTVKISISRAWNKYFTNLTAYQ